MKTTPCRIIALACLLTANAYAIPTVLITNDWAFVQARVVTPKPALGPLIRAWESEAQGAADLAVSINSDGLGGYAGAGISRSIFVSFAGAPVGYTRLFGAKINVDDTDDESMARIDSFWDFSVTEDPAQYFFRHYAEMGSSTVNFSLFDLTTGTLADSNSTHFTTGFGTLAANHDYRLELHYRAPFGTGDGVMGFGFGFANGTQVSNAANITHLPVPDGGATVAMLGGAVMGLAGLRRKLAR